MLICKQIVAIPVLKIYKHTHNYSKDTNIEKLKLIKLILQEGSL